ncbi:IS3 family transposase [Streptomyces sp. NPDC006967]|uniref:IS3 family transposase n=1 Tax=unclassified Streptomyces TaxID=2593676 RepID=UPI0033F5B690
MDRGRRPGALPENRTAGRNRTPGCPDRQPQWRRRPDEPAKREVGRARLEERIVRFRTTSGGAHGSPEITPDLWAEGRRVSVNTVAEVVAELGLQGRKPPERRRSATRQGRRRATPDLVYRRFGAVAADLLRYGYIHRHRFAAPRPGRKSPPGSPGSASGAQAQPGRRPAAGRVRTDHRRRTQPERPEVLGPIGEVSTKPGDRQRALPIPDITYKPDLDGT